MRSLQDQAKRLLSYLYDYGITISFEEALLCCKHLDLVVEKNKVMNLTRITNIDEALVLHLCDSLLLLPFVNQAPFGKLLDMGSGAGFPGIDLAITSKRPTVLIDSVGKKVNAVNEFIEQLPLSDAIAVHKRLEVVSSSDLHSFTCVTARALASLPVLIEYAEPYLKKNGLLVLTKGNPSDDELSSGFQAADICGLQLIDEPSFELPANLGHREFFVFKKIKRSSVKLPRQIGLARKNPLA